MALTTELKELTACVGKLADRARADVMRDLERSVCGCAYGGTSHTTRREAEHIADVLRLRPGCKLLDVGGGTGWPGRYLSQLTGCDAVVVDLPIASLRVAHERIVSDQLAARCGVVSADAAELPFGEHSFDAVSHSDLLCCTPDKLGVLRACRRVARDGARTIFSTISPAPSGTDAQRAMAIASGPKFVEVAEDYEVLLDRSGWRLEKRTDVTPEFLRFLRGELEGMRAREAALVDVFGAEDLAQRFERQEAAIAAVGAGSLRRELFLAHAEASAGAG